MLVIVFFVLPSQTCADIFVTSPVESLLKLVHYIAFNICCKILICHGFKLAAFTL